MTKITTLSNENYISTQEASKRYNYCLKSIRRWVKTRKVKGFKHARKWYVHEPSLRVWVEQLYKR